MREIELLRRWGLIYPAAALLMAAVFMSACGPTPQDQQQRDAIATKGYAVGGATLESAEWATCRAVPRRPEASGQGNYTEASA